jgi:hypothetical protein
MTKQELIEFIEDNYADGEQLIWQIVSANDLGDQEDFTYETWNDFVEYYEQSSHNAIADDFTHSTRNALIDFIDENGDN